MFIVQQFSDYVIIPALEDMDMMSEGAVQLLLGTAAAESKLGTYLRQVNGPALGVYQIEPATHHDIWENYLKYRPEMADTIRGFVGDRDWDEEADRPSHSTLITNLHYATMMARLVYYRRPDQIPEVDDWWAHGEMWKRDFNTVEGKGTVDKFMKALKSCRIL